jgi:hypothetical protein
MNGAKANFVRRFVFGVRYSMANPLVFLQKSAPVNLQNPVAARRAGLRSARASTVDS